MKTKILVLILAIHNICQAQTEKTIIASAINKNIKDFVLTPDQNHFIAVGQAGNIVKYSTDLKFVKDLSPSTNYYFSEISKSETNNYYTVSEKTIFQSVDEGNTWSIIYQDPTLSIKDVYFINDTIGFAVFGDFLFANNISLRRTIDGGKTWVRCFDLPEKYDVTSFYKVHQNKLYFYNWDAVYVSTTKGASWFYIATFIQSFVERCIKDVQYLNDSTALVLINHGSTTPYDEIFRTDNYGKNWNRIYKFPTGINSTHQLMTFTSNTKGYIISVKNDTIRKTNDGGFTWQSYPLTNAMNVNSLLNKNSDTLYFGTDQGLMVDVDQNNKLQLFGTHNILNCIQSFGNDTIYSTGIDFLKSTDAGKTWLGAEDNLVELESQFFINSKLGFVGGNSIYKTTDGGKNWTKKFTLTYANEKAVKIYFIDSITGICLINNSTILISNNKGETWSTYNFESDESLVDICFTNKQVGYILCTENYNIKIYKTLNAGSTWQLHKTIQGVKAGSILMQDNGFGLLGGYGTSGPYSIRYTTDGGYTWNILNGNSGYFSSRGNFISSNTYIYSIGTSNIYKIDRTIPTIKSLENNFFQIVDYTTDLTFINDTTAFVCASDGSILKVNNANLSNKVKAEFSTSQTTYCINQKLEEINNSKNALYYKWYINNVLVSSFRVLSYTFTNAGNYEIKLIASNNDYIDSTIQYVNVIQSTVNLSLPNKTVCEFESFQYNLTHDNIPNKTFQWQIKMGPSLPYVNLTDDSIFNGVNTSTLNVLANINYNSCSIRCMIIDCYTRYSSVSVLTVKPITKITKDASTQYWCNAMSSISIPTQFSGNNLVYKWQINTGGGFINLVNNSIYNNVSTNTLVINNLPQSLDNYKYRCMAIGTCGDTIYTNEVSTIKLTKPKVVEHPVDITTYDGGNVLMRVKANSNLFTYQWQYNQGNGFVNIIGDNNFNGINTSTLSIKSNIQYNNYTFRCIVNGCNPLNSDTSNFATLTIQTLPYVNKTIIGNSKNCTADSTVLSIDYNSLYPLFFQWQSSFEGQAYVDIHDDEIYKGTQSSILTIYSNTEKSYRYRCVIKNSFNYTIYTNDKPVSFIDELNINLSPQEQYISTKCSSINIDFEATGSIEKYIWQKYNGQFFEPIENDSIFSTAGASLFIRRTISSLNGLKIRCQIISKYACDTIYTHESLIIITNASPIIQNYTIENGCFGDTTHIKIDFNGIINSHKWYISFDGNNYQDLDNVDTTYKSVVLANSIYFSRKNEDIFREYHYYKCVLNAGCDLELSPKLTIKTISCVWPGDADNNNTVNLNDLIYLGSMYNTVGTPRSIISNTWASQYCENWTQYSINNINAKYMDCNGDGIINEDDTLAIVTNFKRLHQRIDTISNNTNNNEVSLQAFTDKESYSSGDWVNINLNIQNTSTLPDSIIGLSYRLFPNQSFIEENSISINNNSEIFGNNIDNNISIRILSTPNNEMNIAVAKKDKIAVKSDGNIGSVRFRIKESANTANYAYHILNPIAYSKGLHTIEVNGKSALLKVTKLVGTNPKLEEKIKINLYPNPSNGNTKLLIFDEDNQTKKVELFTELGQFITPLHANNSTNNQSEYEISNSINKLRSGVYIIKIQVADKYYYKKLIIL